MFDTGSKLGGGERDVEALFENQGGRKNKFCFVPRLGFYKDCVEAGDNASALTFSEISVPSPKFERSSRSAWDCFEMKKIFVRLKRSPTQLLYFKAFENSRRVLHHVTWFGQTSGLI